jgi:hypothetical protein
MLSRIDKQHIGHHGVLGPRIVDTTQSAHRPRTVKTATFADRKDVKGDTS